MKSSFVLYHDVRGPLELLSDEQRGKLFLAILNYSERGEFPDFTDSALAMAFAFIKNAIDRDAEAWEIKRQKKVAAGSLGGKQRAKNLADAKCAIATQADASTSKQNQANQAVPVPVPVPVPELVPVPVNNIADKPQRAARFAPPTIEEVSSYCQERGNNVDAEKFVNHYAAVGWKVGRNKMQDWRAAVRTWENSAGDSDIRTPRNYSFREGDSL